MQKSEFGTGWGLEPLVDHLLESYNRVSISSLVQSQDPYVTKTRLLSRAIWRICYYYNHEIRVPLYTFVGNVRMSTHDLYFRVALFRLPLS